jgi:nitrogen regulatory protein P-II 1
MKLIKCIIQPAKLNEVIDGLQGLVAGMTVAEVRGIGRQKGHTLVYRGREYEMPLLPKIMIDVVTEDNKVDDVIRLVIERARTGRLGDGRIFVLPVEENYHVRTGFMDRD